MSTLAYKDMWKVKVGEAILFDQLQIVYILWQHYQDFFLEIDKIINRRLNYI